MINGYDFDKTIYDGDSSIDFYLYALKSNYMCVLAIPKQIIGIILYMIRVINKTKCKEYFFSFLKYVNDIDKLVLCFWDKNIYKIKKWYKLVHEDSDIIVSASPEFLLKPLEGILKVKVISSLVNEKTGKFESNNCYGREKVKRFNKKIKGVKLNKFYSDSMSDKPMMDLAMYSYLVKGNRIILLENKKMKYKHF